MAMTRQERLSIHKKQERLQVSNGVPSANELTEGVPVLRSTPEGLVEYVRYHGVLHKKVFDRDGSKEDKDFRYAYFGAASSDISSFAANTHYPIPFGFGSSTAQSDVDFGTGTDPSDTFTTADTDTQYASQIVPMLWRVPDNITIDSITHIEGADNATGDTTRMHLKSFTFTSGATACLTAGALLAHNSDVTNAGNEQPYLSTWTVDSANVDAGKVILCFFRSDSVNSDFSINVTVKYHLR